MFIDEGIFEKVLKTYGFTLEEVIEAAKKHKIPKAEQDWIYLIHHFHPPKKVEDMETLHHCWMYEKKNLKGIEYEQIHVKDGKVFQHALKIKNIEDAPKSVFDHLNNEFKVMVKEIKETKYAVITGPIKLADVKWSMQDRGNYDNISS